MGCGLQLERLLPARGTIRGSFGSVHRLGEPPQMLTYGVALWKDDSKPQPYRGPSSKPSIELYSSAGRLIRKIAVRTSIPMAVKVAR